MTITDVRVRKIASEGKMKAIVSVTFDNEFVVHDIKVIEGQNGLFIAMPSRKTPDGEFKDIAHPINTETRERIQSAILEAYEKPSDKIDSQEREILNALICYPYDFVEIIKLYYYKQKSWEQEVFIGRLKNKIELDDFRIALVKRILK